MSISNEFRHGAGLDVHDQHIALGEFGMRTTL